MHLDRIRISPAARPEYVRLTGRVSYATPALDPEEVWFELPSDRPISADRGDPWLAALLPAATVLGEELSADAEVDARLLEGMHSLQLIWSQWFPRLRPIRIDVTPRHGSIPTEPRRASFFSGGVDSFYTLLRRNGATSPAEGRIDDLLTVGGFDIPHHRVDQLAALQRRAGRVARESGCAPVFVTTNLRATRFGLASWAWQSHGCAMAAVALLFGGRWSEVLIPASAGFVDLHPWGTHSLTDRLFSTQATTFSSDGDNRTRVEKLSSIADHPLVAEALRVCWVHERDANCSRCAKCLRTKAVLTALGAGGIPAFQWGPRDISDLSRILARHPFERRQLLEIQQLAAQTGKRSIAGAVDAALRRSARFGRMERLARPLAALPLLWRLPSATDAWAARNGLA